MVGSLRRHDPDQVPAVGSSSATLSARSAPDSRAICTRVALIRLARTEPGVLGAAPDVLGGAGIGSAGDHGPECQWASILCSYPGNGGGPAMTSADTTGRRPTWVDLPAARPAGDAGVTEAIGAGFTHSGPDSYPEYGAAAFEAGGGGGGGGPRPPAARPPGRRAGGGG